jgi:endonuclease YncB( thermonuclease family)
MIRALTLAMLGAASFAGVYYFAAPGGEPPPEVATQTSPTQSSKATSETGSIASAVDVLQSMRFELRPSTDAVEKSTETARAVRDVTPDNMTAGPKVTGTVTRVRVSAGEAQPARPKSERLFNAIVVSAGALKAKDREIQLAGIAAPEFEERCGEGAAAWPCGRMARAALQRFIRGRAIECEIPPGADKLPDPATCAVGGENVSEWLVARGWAKRSGAPFEDAENKAREAKLGVWSKRRPDQATDVASTGG